MVPSVSQTHLGISYERAEAEEETIPAYRLGARAASLTRDMLAMRHSMRRSSSCASMPLSSAPAPSPSFLRAGSDRYHSEDDIEDDDEDPTVWMTELPPSRRPSASPPQSLVRPSTAPSKRRPASRVATPLERARAFEAELMAGHTWATESGVGGRPPISHHWYAIK